MPRHLLSIAHCAAAMLAAVLLIACSQRGQETLTSSPAGTAMTSMAADTQSVVVTAARSRPSPPVSTVGVTYLTITNHGMKTDRLLGASSPVAARIELHANSMKGDMARMRPVEALELSPHQTAVMDPGGMHFMLTDLVAPLVAGEHFPLTLRFATAGEITVDVVVQEDAGAPGDAHQHDRH